MLEDILVPIFAMSGGFFLSAFIIVVISRNRQKRAELKAQVQTKLIEKFSSAPELLQFLESPQGRQLVDSIERQPMISANERILAGIRKGIILTFMGLAFLALWLVNGNYGMTWPAFILLALGLAFFISTFVSLKLSRSWGLSPTQTPRGMDS